MARRNFNKITLNLNKEVLNEKKEDNEMTFMQPEILPIKLMLEFMIQRGVITASSCHDDRETIIKLFCKHVSPKPQRIYRENRRGKILALIRKRREKKVEDVDWNKFVVDYKNASLTPSRNIGCNLTSQSDRLKPAPSQADRLKPPLPTIETDKKTIKLSSKSSSFDNIVINKRKLSTLEIVPALSSLNKNVIQKIYSPISVKIVTSANTEDNIKKVKQSEAPILENNINIEKREIKLQSSSGQPSMSDSLVMRKRDSTILESQNSSSSRDIPGNETKKLKLIRSPIGFP